MEREGENIVQLRPFRLIENEPRTSIVQNVLSTIRGKTSGFLSSEYEPENPELLKRSVFGILKKRGCVVKISNEVFEEIYEDLDDFYTTESDILSLPRVVYNNLWARCPNQVSGKTLCEELNKMGINIDNPSEIFTLAKEINSGFTVPKILCFNHATDSSDRRYVYVKTPAPLFAKHALFLHRNAIV